MNISKIKPYIQNAKKHTKKQIEQVAASIKEFGFNQPIVVDRHNTIIVGHGRYEAAKLLGMTEVPTIQLLLTEEQCNAYRLADNKLNESEWDMKLVIDELKGLSSEMLDLTGFDKDLIIEPSELDDVIPENVPSRSKLGDLYELGQHRVLCGDSTQPEAVLRLMDGKKADMVFTDPPYGINLETDYSKLPQTTVKDKKYSKVIGDDFEFKFNDFSWIECKEQFWWGADYYCNLLPKGGSWLVWDKRNENNDTALGSGFELLWSKVLHKRKLLRYLWSGFTARDKGETRKHPTQKPINLCAEIIKEYGKEGWIVLDLFLGSGSTLIACEKTGRICYGMELDPKYIDVIVQRYVDYVDEPIVKLNGKTITWKKTVSKTA